MALFILHAVRIEQRDLLSDDPYWEVRLGVLSLTLYIGCLVGGFDRVG